MKVNGETIPRSAPVSLKDFLEASGYTQGRIAVELNGEIIPKLSYASVLLSEADTLEIVHFVGGG